MGTDDGRPGEDQGGLTPEDEAAAREAEERARARAAELYEATQDELGTNGIGERRHPEHEHKIHEADRVLGARAAESREGEDPDERALRDLEAFLKATGEYHEGGSVWQPPTVQASPAHGGALDPPAYGGPDGRAAGRHRESTRGKVGRRRWWHRWTRP
jgi:hypothetical protein